MSSYQTIETPQDYVNYTFNISARGVTEVAGEMAGLSNTITTILGQLAFKTSEYLTHTESLVIGLGTTSVAAFASATKEAIKFEQAIANVQAIGGESIDAMKIGQEAMKYSSQFGMDVNSMTEGLEALSRAGLTATNVMSGVLEEGVKLSKLEGMDLEDSINNLISTTNLLSTEDLDINSQEYADAVKAMNQHIVSTSESAPINAENIIQTLQHVGGYASANSIDQEDLFAVIAQLGAKGTKGEMAGTALRAFIAAGQKDQAQRALTRIGLNVSDLWDESGEAMLPVSEMKDVIDSALDARGYSKQEKLEFYSDFAGYKQANQIMKIDTSEVKEYKETIAQAWDLGKKLETILGTTHNNIQTLFQTTKNFMTKVGKTALPLINAIVIPLKWGVQLLDAMPFSENIVGILAAMAGIKALLLFVNRVVPTLASMYTSFAGAEKKAKGIYGYMHDMVEDLKGAKDVLTHINDPIYLSNIRIEQGLMGEQSYKMHKEVTKEVYKDLKLKQPDLPDWDELENFNQEAIFDLMESYKKTDVYQDKQMVKTNKIKGINDTLQELLLGEKSTPEKADVDWRPSNIDNNTQNRLNSDSEIHKDLATVTNYMQEVQALVEKNAKNKEQKDIGVGIMSVAHKLADVFVAAFNKNKNQSIMNVDGLKIKVDKENKGEVGQTIKQLRTESQKKNLPDIGFAYDYDINKINKAREALIKDINSVASDFANTNLEYINATQRKRIGKQLDINEMTSRGKRESSLRNEAEIRDIFRKFEEYEDAVRHGLVPSIASDSKNLAFNTATSTFWVDPKDKNKGIRIEQIEAFEDVLGIENASGNRAERIQRILQEYEGLSSNERYIALESGIYKAKQSYSEFLNNRETPSAILTSHISNDVAKELLEHYSINTNLLTGTPAEQLQQAFHGLEKGQQEEIKEVLYANQKRHAQGIYTESEITQLSMMFDKLAMLDNAIDKYNFNFNIQDALEKDLYEIFGTENIPQEFLSQIYNGKFMVSTPGGYEGGFYSNGIDDDIEYDYDYLHKLAHDEYNPTESVHSEPLSDNTKSTCCNEIKKFLTTITQDLADFSKIFNQIHKKIEDIFEEIRDKETIINNNIYNTYNTLNVFRQNMEQGIKSLPQDIGNTIREGLLLPQSTIKDEDVIDVQALVVEDVEKAVLMIESAYIAPKHVTDDNDYKESNISLRQLYDEVYGPKSPKYDTPPLLGTLLALPEKIQEVTTDFILLGEAIDLSKEALEGYLLRNTTLLMLPQGSPKGYHNAYPDNAGIFPPLPMDTLTSARNLYTQRVINEPYNVTEQQLRSVGLHGLVPIWQQNLQKFTPYENPIGPKPDNTDLDKYLQAQAIEEENKRLRKQQEAQAHAELQAREAEKLAGITERYNKKMEESKARGDKKAAENLAAIEQARADREDRRDRERPLEDKVVDALHSPELAEAISLTDKKEKKDEWDKRVENIKYNQHKNAQVTTLGMSGYYAYLNDIAYEKIQEEKRNQELINGHNQIENELLIKEARRLAPLYKHLFVNYTELNEIIEKEIKDRKNLRGATNDLINNQKQYPTPIGPQQARAGDHNAAQESLKRLKDRRKRIEDEEYKKHVDNYGYGYGMGQYYSYISTPSKQTSNNKTTKKIGLTALEQAALMKKQNDNLKAQQEEFLNIAVNVSQQAKIEEDNRKKIENINKIVKELEEEYDKLVKDIRIRYELGESLTNEEVALLPNDKRVVKTKDGETEIYEGIRDTEFSRNPQRALAMMFDRFESQQNAVKVREPLSLLEREAYNATRMLFDRFEMAYEFIQNSMTAIAEILIGIHNQVLKLNGGPVTEYIDTKIVPPKLLGEGDSRDSTITMKGGVAYGGSEEDVRAWEEEWENIPEEPTYWEEKAQQMKDSFKNIGKSVDDFLDKKLSKFSDDTSGLGKASRKVRLFTYDLESFQDAMTKAGKIFPPFLAIAAAMESIIGVLSFLTTGLATAETVLTAARMINTQVTKEQAKKEGKEAAWRMAKTIEQYTEGHKNIQTIIKKGSKYITQAGHAIMGAVDTVIGFIIENIAIIGPIAAAIAIAVGALWLSEQNHAKALKKATEEYEEAHKEASASYITYKNLHEARKNEHDAMKRQQLARKESIALYKLETDRIRQLNAIEEKQKLKNDVLWGEYGLRAELQKQGFPFIGEFESQYEQYEGSTGEIRRIKEDTLGNGGVMTTNQAAVSAWYDAHARQLAQIEAFAPELQELYDLESRLIDKYGSKEAARDSKEFKEAVQEFSDATGLNKETAEKYLDYLQTEANVEHARYAMQAEVDMIVSNAQAEAYKALYGDKAGIGELDSVQDAMVYATADQIFKDAYQELWWSMLMEWLAAIWNQLTLNFDEAQKHAKAAGAYQDGMRELAENQGRITQEGVDIAKEDQRKDYENQSYSYYGDTPFGGAQNSSAAMEQDWALEAIYESRDDYKNASKMNGEAAVEGFKKGLDQHSPGKIARSMKAEMTFSKEAIKKGGKSVTQEASSISGTITDAFNFIGNTASSAFGEVYSATSNVFGVVSDGVEWVGGTIFDALTSEANTVFKGFNKSSNKASNVKVDNSKTEIHIHTLNINTEDDPEKIKTAFMNLMIELGEQIVPRQVSRIVGEPPATSTPTTQNSETEGTDSDIDTNNDNSNTNNNTNPT